MYQDSLYIPVVHYMNKTLKLVAELYIMRRDYELASKYQARLSYYLACLENCTLPNFPCATTHQLNHLLKVIITIGPLYKNTNYQTESKYKGTSQGHTVSRNVVKSLSNREFVKIIAGIISFVSFTEYNVSGKALSLDNLSISQAELDKLASRSLTDDYFFQLDVDEVHKPYCECVGRECNEWGKWFGNLVPFLQSHMTPKGCYHSLSWGGEKYRAIENGPVTYTSKWLSSHLDSVVYTMGYDHIRYYLIHQLIVYAVDGCDYPMAICSFIPTKSAETDCFSNHDVLVEDVWNKESIFVISLYCLRTRPAISGMENNVSSHYLLCAVGYFSSWKWIKMHSSINFENAYNKLFTACPLQTQYRIAEGLFADASLSSQLLVETSVDGVAFYRVSFFGNVCSVRRNSISTSIPLTTRASTISSPCLSLSLLATLCSVLTECI